MNQRGIDTRSDSAVMAQVFACVRVRACACVRVRA